MSVEQISDVILCLTYNSAHKICFPSLSHTQKKNNKKNKINGEIKLNPQQIITQLFYKITKKMQVIKERANNKKTGTGIDGDNCIRLAD